MGNEQGKIRVLLADDSQETLQSVRKLLSLEDDVEVVGEAQNGREAVDKAKSLRPHIILMDMRMPEMDGIAATEAIAAELPTVQVIMVSVAGTAESLRRAMLAGAREYLVKPFEPDELVASVRRVHELYAPPEEVAEPPAEVAFGDHADEPAQGTIVAVFGPKGGVGRTTVATNLAVALAKNYQKRTLLFDGCLRFGDVGLALGLRSERSIADLAGFQPGDIDKDMIDDVTVKHPTGLSVILAPPRPLGGGEITQEAVRKILQELRTTYDYVVVDSSSSLQETDTVLLNIADSVLALFTLELTALKNARLFVELAQSLGCPRDRLVMVANRVDEASGVRLADVEANLHFRTSFCLRNDAKVATYALNKGVPFVLTHKHSSLARSIDEIAKMLVSGEKKDAVSAGAKPLEKKTGRLGSLFSRRGRTAA